jgi:hypothetical protein
MRRSLWKVIFPEQRVESIRVEKDSHEAQESIQRDNAFIQSLTCKLGYPSDLGVNKCELGGAHVP